VTDADRQDHDDLPNIGRPARGALHVIGVTTLAEVAQMTEEELLAIHGVGPKAVRILEQTLADQGRGLAQG
jgi:predicted flap endonuclease-1-like 5' DNA nuclease